jgi:L-rhamnose-proton symport protein (RhaT)
MAIGLGLVVFAAFLQGIFLLPASRQRDWAWEHMWLGFSLFGMIVGNWILALLLLPNPLAIYAAVPRQDLLILTCFGLAWGGGAVLFGMGMDRLGLTLGYPLIMGLNASFGTVIPLLWLFGGSIFTGRRLAILAGTAIAVCGIAACSGPERAAVPMPSGRRVHPLDSSPASLLPSPPGSFPASPTWDSPMQPACCAPRRIWEPRPLSPETPCGCCFLPSAGLSTWAIAPSS